MPPVCRSSSGHLAYVVNGKDKNPCLGRVDILAEGGVDQHNEEIVCMCVSRAKYLKYFRLRGPYSLCRNCSVATKQPRRKYMMDMAVCQQSQNLQTQVASPWVLGRLLCERAVGAWGEKLSSRGVVDHQSERL